MLVCTKFQRPRWSKGRTTRFSRHIKGEEMIKFQIYEQDTRTKKNTLLDHIDAGNILEAKKAYIKMAKWEPRRHVKLVVKTPQMR